MLSALQRLVSPTFLRQSLTSRITAAPLILHTRLYNTEFRKDSTWQFFANYSSTGEAPEPIKQTPTERWQNNSKRLLDKLAEHLPASAYRGRSVKVVDGNIMDAYKRLDIRLARNKVRYELKLTERHEKKGVKRRRLSSERWRNRFADEVRKKVALVKAIRRRGS